MRDSFIELFWNKQGTPKQTDATDETPDESRAPLPAGTATPEAVAKLRSAIGMEQGSAYTSFMAIVDKLEKAITDPKARWKAALDVAQTQAISEADILARFSELREKLKAEAESSALFLDSMEARDVGPRRAELEKLSGELVTAQERVKALEAKIGEAAELKTAAEQAVRGMAANFQAAHDTVLRDIEYAQGQFMEMLGIG